MTADQIERIKTWNQKTLEKVQEIINENNERIQKIMGEIGSSLELWSDMRLLVPHVFNLDEWKWSNKDELFFHTEKNKEGQDEWRPVFRAKKTIITETIYNQAVKDGYDTSKIKYAAIEKELMQQVGPMLESMKPIPKTGSYKLDAE